MKIFHPGFEERDRVNSSEKSNWVSRFRLDACTDQCEDSRPCMIVPQYWAESRLQHRQEGRQFTVRRHGWSDASQIEAQSNADNRAREALQRLLSGEKVLRREPKIPYNGAQGVPIREEIVSRHGDTVVTRNSYGARCLNTPDVFFADVDFQYAPSWRFSFGVFGVLLLGAGGVGWGMDSRSLGMVMAFLALIFSGFISRSLYGMIQGKKGGPEGVARSRVSDFLARHPEWNLRLYRTPAGMRVMAMHQTFNPSDPAVIACFQALGTDPIYAKMCLNQQCFRARVSAKPWRIGIGEHMRPRPGVWPVAPERMALRTSWIHRYETAARSFAACKFMEAIGSGVTHPETKLVQELHDEMCCALSALPLA